MKSALRAGAVVIGLFLALFLLQYFGDHARQARESWPDEEQYVTLPPKAAARYTYLGYNELAADVTWSRMLVYYGSGFIGEGDFRYLSKFIHNIIALDPKFRKLYFWAMYTVTVNENHQVSTKKEDILESIAIAERAMKEFPNDYEFYWVAGIRYFLDLKSDDPAIQRAYKERGSELIEEAMHKPDAPKSLATTAAALRSQLGQFEQARANLTKMILTTDDPAARAKMLSSFKAIAGDGLGEELERATELFSELRAGYTQLPPDLFVLMGGPERGGVINFDSLATERDLFGAEAEPDQLKLF